MSDKQINKSYIARISDNELKKKLEASGALLIRGMKACGKTMSAQQFSSSMIAMDMCNHNTFQQWWRCCELWPIML